MSYSVIDGLVCLPAAACGKLRLVCCSRRLDDTEAGVACALLLALRHAAPLGLGFPQVGVLATHVFDPDQRPVRLVHLLLYEAA